MITEKIQLFLSSQFFDNIVQFIIPLIIVFCAVIIINYGSNKIRKITSSDNEKILKNYNLFYNFLLFSFFLSLTLVFYTFTEQIINNELFVFYIIFILISGIYCIKYYKNIKMSTCLVKTDFTYFIENEAKSEIKYIGIFTLFLFSISIIYFLYLLILIQNPKSNISFETIVASFTSAATIIYAGIAYYSHKETKEIVQINQKQAEDMHQQTEDIRRQINFIEISQLESKIYRLKKTKYQLNKISGYIGNIAAIHSVYNSDNDLERYISKLRIKHAEIDKLDHELALSLDIDSDKIKMDLKDLLITLDIKTEYNIFKPGELTDSEKKMLERINDATAAEILKIDEKIHVYSLQKEKLETLDDF